MTHWWGEFEIELGGSRYWRIGSLSLWVTRLEHEWQVAHRWSSDPFDETYELERRDVELPRELERHRYLFVDSGTKLRLTARVADLPVVARPEQPLVLPAGESARLYVASPAWVELSAGKPAVAFAELPVWRMSSTWFGEDKLEGSVCYATRSRASLQPVRTNRSPRILTSVDLRNACDVALRVQRLALPLPQMSLFCGANDQLWTEATGVNYDPEVVEPALIESAPPKEAGAVTRISGSRKDRHQNMLARALAVAFGGLLP